MGGAGRLVGGGRRLDVSFVPTLALKIGNLGVGLEMD